MVHNFAEARDRLARGLPAMVWQRRIADTLTPVGAALALFEDGRGDFLLESVEGGEARGRYSLLGIDPDLVLKAEGVSAAVNRDWRRDRDAFEEVSGNGLAALRALLAEIEMPVPEDLPPALALLVGYFGYETISLVEKLPRASEDPLGLPDMVFSRPGLLLVFDALTDEVFLIAPVWPSDAEPEQALDAAGERIDEALRRLAQPLPQGAADPATLDPEAMDLRPTVAGEDYAARVARAQDYILAGDIFQVVLAQRFTTPFPHSAMALYRALRRVNPSPFLYLLDLPEVGIVGSSPEILVRLRDGQVTIRPIAGTRPRGASPQADRAAERELLADPKERAEHLMLLDLGRNDVGRVCAPGSVEVTDSFMVERYSHVMHIVSNVQGRLGAGKDALDALFAGFPAGTVSGAPKLRACEIIAELEAEKRGPYAGGVGYFAPDGSFDSCIVLRTGLVKDGTLHVTAGAGIVADSDPASEQRECEAKAGALLAAAREAVHRHDEAGFGQ
ncbi:anthranilate synthase component I [Alteriqipengyuania lutimaris]|uniref:Anthranilate synthase component 1 n=1 Tax=Alteriqipengyuania lutimaris TaxID=1538146 RepID=A0A395LRC9_9SPHN|nr:anthranilate synthase component I [Alteriqipengyuania lutimaris]MBB3032820.1 anthranilate synthase component 1 [Alteriqipengyuania lutimaris]RDS78084.1 anthranilate synthase component I [Alteriqipengyuania lutimaris]